MKTIKNNNKQCPICKKKISGTFVVINGGSMEYVGPERYGMHNKEDQAFLSIHKHDISYYGEFKSIDINKNSPYGQFDLYLCSIDCLKRLFDNIIKELQ